MNENGGFQDASWTAVPVRINEKWCKGCGICTSFCPRGVLQKGKGGKPFVAAPDKCTACATCQILCPDLAITVIERRRKSEYLGNPAQHKGPQVKAREGEDALG